MPDYFGLIAVNVPALSFFIDRLVYLDMPDAPIAPWKPAVAFSRAIATSMASDTRL